MSSGPHKISVVQRCSNLVISTQLFHRRLRVALDAGDIRDARATLRELERLYDSGLVTDKDLYEADRKLVAMRQWINGLFGPPEGPDEGKAA